MPRTYRPIVSHVQYCNHAIGLCTNIAANLEHASESKIWSLFCLNNSLHGVSMLHGHGWVSIQPLNVAALIYMA
jgi:hypothetical protein